MCDFAVPVCWRWNQNRMGFGDVETVMSRTNERRAIEKCLAGGLRKEEDGEGNDRWGGI